MTCRVVSHYNTSLKKVPGWNVCTEFLKSSGKELTFVLSIVTGSLSLFEGGGGEGPLRGKLVQR